MLSIENLIVNYGAIKALKGVSLNAHEGEIITIVGSNGAGKSTLMNSIMGLIPKAAGKITFNGKDITHYETRSIVSLGLILAPEGRQIFPDFSVETNLQLGGYFNNQKQNQVQLEKTLEIFPALKKRLKQLGGTLSGGEQQMLAIGRAMMANPKLLMMDEPSLGLAPLLINNIFKMFQSIRDMGVTIILVEQNARMALKISDRGYVLETGNIVIEDTASNLLKSDAVIKAYLG